ncbi:hypothetical protein JCM10213_003279 [Rhodosporidiobolus nylandii]
MLDLEPDEKAAEEGKQPSTFRRCFAKLTSLHFRIHRRSHRSQLPGSAFPPSLQSAQPLPTPPPASFPSPAQVRKYGKPAGIADFEDRRVWNIAWKGVRMFVKEGTDVDEGEAKIMELARAATGLPIPKVYHVIKEGDSTFIYLEALPGDTLQHEHIYPPREAERALRSDLASAVKKLHGVRAPPGIRVGGLGRKSLAALLAEADVSPSLASTADFHAWLRTDYLATFPSSSAAAEYDSEIAPHLDDSAPLVLVHGDLRPPNLLIHDGRLSGIVDFGRAGWYPEWVEGFGPACEMSFMPEITIECVAQAVFAKTRVEGVELAAEGGRRMAGEERGRLKRGFPSPISSSGRAASSATHAELLLSFRTLSW